MGIGCILLAWDINQQRTFGDTRIKTRGICLQARRLKIQIFGMLGRLDW